MTTLDVAASGDRSRADERLAQWTRVLCVLFFFSGFPALIYQLTWQRALFRIFGVNIESVTIVVTAFMLGLGLGSLAGGWLSKRRGIPLLPLLAVIELLTGAFGLASLAIFDQVGVLTAGWPLPAMAAVNLALVIVPTLLMGATLPVLVSHLVRRSGNVGSAVGLLYYVNTLGAGAACLACAVLIFPFLGMQGAVYVAVAMNIAVAIGALAMHWRDRRDAASAEPDAPAATVVRQPTLGLAAVLALAAAGGFVSLSYEIFFFRTVSYASGSSATAFAVTLSAFLVGLASGARQAGENCATLSREEAMRRAVNALMAANLLGLVFLPLLGHLAWLDRGVIGVAILLVYLVARFWGSLLPYLAEFGIAADRQAGMRTALLYLANILGAAAGSILTGFVLMDHMGLVGIGAMLVAAGFLCVILMLAAVDLPRRQKFLRVGFAAALAVLATISIPAFADRVLDNLQWKGAADAKPLVDVVETRSGIIAVDAGGTVFGNGMYDGRFNTDLKHDSNGIVRPYALSLFHAAPRNVLMIGFSSGSWAQVIANNPNVESLTIVEINPGYLQLVARAPEVASVLTNSKVKVITDDGRRWLRLNPNRKFDAIVSNTTWHFRANVTNLVSAEFLDLISDHLNPGGIFFYNTTDADRVQRTGCVAFAHGARFTNHMLVSASPIAWDFVRWRRVLEAYRIDGKAVFDPARAEDRAVLDGLMAMETSLAPEAKREVYRPLEPCPDILARTAGKRIVTDDNMGTEWRYFLGLE
jgi:spermidine synthase/predicted MFS family arabinose efflux permease